MRSGARWLAVTVLLAVACSGHSPTEPQPQQESLGVPFLLSNGQAIVIPSERLQLTFRGVISDSRCAPGMLCIVQGEIVAGIDLGVGGGGPVFFQLSTMSQTEKTISGYLVQLLEASSSGLPPNGGTYQLKLVITK